MFVALCSSYPKWTELTPHRHPCSRLRLVGVFCLLAHPCTVGREAVRSWLSGFSSRNERRA
eukprot:7279709-Prymnesium_polylepis.1